MLIHKIFVHDSYFCKSRTHFNNLLKKYDVFYILLAISGDDRLCYLIYSFILLICTSLKSEIWSYFNLIKKCDEFDTDIFKNYIQVYGRIPAFFYRIMTISCPNLFIIYGGVFIDINSQTSLLETVFNI